MRRAFFKTVFADRINYFTVCGLSLLLRTTNFRSKFPIAGWAFGLCMIIIIAPIDIKREQERTGHTENVAFIIFRSVFYAIGY